MSTWSEMGIDNRNAAKELLILGYFRSSVSRSYYSAYCAVTGAVADKLTSATTVIIQLMPIYQT